jgi:hypothetical protein
MRNFSASSIRDAAGTLSGTYLQLQSACCADGLGLKAAIKNP